MKKILSAILMAAILLTSVLAFTACGGSASNPVLKVIDIPLTSEEYAFAVKKGDAELLASVNSFLAEIKANGKFDEIVNKYFGDGTPTGVTSAAEDASKDQLVVATNAAFAPFEYKEGDTYYGVDMEIMAALAESLGKELVISNMEFESVCTAVAEGMCDVAAAGLTVNETRKQILDFSDSYYNASQVLITKADDTTFDA
ncbi:MAG: transporter substrate-binding domain-containing protein, partial [Clostridia bacterium]|nr:transporter substrate-binding domain-containing protein [Clostridia bacterium]